MTYDPAEYERRLEVQAQFAQLFVKCPSCMLDRSRSCPLCIGTGHVTRRGAEQYFEDWLADALSEAVAA